MAIETNLESIKDNGGERLVRRDLALIREALETTEFKHDGIIWVTKDGGLDILCWITYEIDTILSASVLAPFAERLIELKADGLNDQRVRNLGDEALVDIAFDLRYAKGTGSFDMYQRKK